MRPIPLNFLTLYADLVQSVAVSAGRGATVAAKTVHGVRRLYAVERIGQSYKQRYLGVASDPDVQVAAQRVKRDAAEAKIRKSTVSVLKRAGIPAPDPYMGRLLEAISEAGLFERGAVLVGTAAYQTYPCVVGTYLVSGLMTQDADVAVPAGLSVGLSAHGGASLESVLRRADPTFEARMNRDERWPKVFVSQSGFNVDVLTPRRRTSGPVRLPELAAAAIPLRYLEYLLQEPIEAVALYGSGVPVRVPSPERYGVHKLIVAGLRAPSNAKSGKDLAQATAVFDVLLEKDPDTLSAAIADARQRGPKWRKLVDAGLKKIGRNVRGEPQTV